MVFINDNFYYVTLPSLRLFVNYLAHCSLVGHSTKLALKLRNSNVVHWKIMIV